MSFVHKYNILVDKPPSERDLCHFLENKMSQGLQNSTIAAYISHLKLACQELYKVRFEELSSLDCLINKSKSHDNFTDGDDLLKETTISGTSASGEASETATDSIGKCFWNIHLIFITKR